MIYLFYDKMIKLFEFLFENQITQNNETINEPNRENPKTLSQLGIRKNAGVKNILAVYNEATDEEKEYWGRWYHHAKEDVKELADKFGINFPVMAAVVATLSPGNKWSANLLAADRIVQRFKAPELSVKINSYPRQILKATKILETGDIGLVSGPKVSVFFKSLLDPESVERELVLDTHAINIWRGVKTSIKASSLPSSTLRAKMVEDYQKAADELGVPVQVVQAITWYIWKYTNNPPKIPNVRLPVEKKKRSIVELKDISTIIQEEVKNLMSKMGYKYVGKNYRLGSDTYIQKDDPDPKSSKKYIKMANKNINKGKRNKKDTLHDPPAVGISLPKNMQG